MLFCFCFFNHTVIQEQHILSQSDKKIEGTTGLKNRNSSVADTACYVKCKRKMVPGTSMCLG